jgi:nicotinamide-nucleotide amidase
VADLVMPIHTNSLYISELNPYCIFGLDVNLLINNQWFLTTAESCTGGLIAATCTDQAGSSNWFERGFVTYSNASKTEMLGVAAELITTHGAVSEPVVHAMAEGALHQSKAQVSVAVTGVAGPQGGSTDKPVGTVWFGFALPWGITTEVRHFAGNRSAIRQATVLHALTRLNELLHMDKVI